jgi:hypothetical protein
MSIEEAVQQDIEARVSTQKCFCSSGYATSWATEEQSLPIFHDDESHRSKRMPFKKLYSNIELGHGQGHRSQYQPWLRIRRKNVSPKSNQVVAWLPPLGREAHFFSRGEYHTALLLLWLQVQDVREQYPLWPVAHPHPLTGADNVDDASLPWSKGLLAIAKEAGIDHGTEVGTKQPYVATMDLVVTVRIGSEVRLFTFSSKPITDPSDEVKWRTLERLELERRYAAEIGAKHVIATSALVPIRTAGYLEWWLDGASLRDHDELLLSAPAFAAETERRSKSLPMAEAVRKAAKALALPLDQAWLLFRHCAWTQKIDIDPTRPLLTTYPIQAGGRALRSAIRRQLFQETV